MGDWTSKAVVAAALVLAAAGAQAQGNGCGTGWNRYLVPDEIKPLGCSFRSACARHDDCYGRCAAQSGPAKPAQCEYLACEPGGALHQQPVCDSVAYRRLRLAAHQRRTVCDAQFMVDLDSDNADKPKCLFWTALYPFAVRVLGGQAFLGADASATLVSEPERRAYANAVNELLDTWSDEQIRAYAQTIRRGEQPVDLGRPIVFDRRSGLRNPK
jgi:hypothetical protein